MDESAEEIKRLQNCISNLLQIGTLPAIWSVGQPASIVNTLLDALVAMLDLDFAYLRLVDAIGEAPIEAAMIGLRQPQSMSPRDVGVALEQWDASAVRVPLGLPGDLGVLVVASTRSGFPSVPERLVVRIAANEAAIALEQARRLEWLLRTESEEATQAERTRVAGELHDTLLQGFTGVTLQLQGLLQRWRADGRDDPAEELSRALSLADVTLREARDAVWDLRASELDHDDLPRALEGTVRRAIGRAPIRLRFDVTGNRRPMAPAIENAVLRIAREAALNAVKHADSPTVEIRLSYERSSVRLDVRDDGRGLLTGDVDAAVKDGHWGVMGMRERARRAGGTLDITSAPGQGTMLSLCIPTESAPIS